MRTSRSSRLGVRLWPRATRALRRGPAVAHAASRDPRPRPTPIVAGGPDLPGAASRVELPPAPPQGRASAGGPIRTWRAGGGARRLPRASRRGRRRPPERPPSRRPGSSGGRRARGAESSGYGRRRAAPDARLQPGRAGGTQPPIAERTRELVRAGGGRGRARARGAASSTARKVIGRGFDALPREEAVRPGSETRQYEAYQRKWLAGSGVVSVRGIVPRRGRR